MSSPALSVVIPIYNEELAIGAVLQEWLDELERLQVDFELRCYDDGSRDGSLRILQEWAERDRRIVVGTHANRGHGPTIMRGYLEARGEWAFQTDGDGEMPASSFEEFWRSRNDYDVVQARRIGRDSTLHRKILTTGARTCVRLLFGASPADANVPYRLMRRTWLQAQLELISPEAAVPNVILSGLAAKTARILQLDVPFRARRAGSSSLNLRRILRLAFRAMLDTAAVALRARAR